MKLNDLAAQVLQHQRSTPDLIAEALRQAIQHGVFAEGQSLRQDEIATQFGVSRIPVREALRQLEAEGLVTLHPNRGAMVAVLSAAAAQEIFEIRLALETTALQLAIPKYTAVDLDQAAAILQATKQTTDPIEWADLNWQFHTALYTPAHRSRLLSMIQMLYVNVDRYIRLQIQAPDYRDLSQQEHHQLLVACQQQDEAAAVKVLQHHIGTSAQQLVEYLQSLHQKQPIVDSPILQKALQKVTYVQSV